MFVSVLGKKIKIKYVDNPKVDSVDVDGFFCPNKMEIIINKQLSKEQLELTLNHEMLHAVLYRCGIHAVLDPMLEEIIVESVSQFLSDSFKFKK